MTDAQQRSAAKEFAEYWSGRGYEKGESQVFWLSLLQEVLGVEKSAHYIEFEDKVMLDHTSFIDGKIPSTHVLIEQKSKDKDLRKPIKQSDGTLLTPFQQAKRYSAELPYSERPRWIVTCNFQEFLIYDMEKPTGEPECILLKDLPKEYYRLKFLTDTGSGLLKQEMELSIKAGEIVGVLYDRLLAQYKTPDENSLKSLNALCVRLVFCLYAEDADIFGGHTLFHDYLEDIPISGMRKALAELFKILDTPEENRDKYLADDNPTLAAFPYVNGGLFADESIEIPPFTEEIKDLLLRKASEDFDWSGISPTIFGAVFESTLNPETRRSGGMHYTSIENIHKVINPLFLDDLQKELNEILAVKTVKTRSQRLEAYTDKLSELKFLDPACGSGNFLTETYISLRRLENRAIDAVNKGQIALDTGNIIKVSIGQFYGIEINDFAVTVAKTALWIAESQMMKETEDIVKSHIEFLPLKSYANIVEGNALRVEWNDVVPKHELNYIMGNPPFVGARIMNTAQKNDLLSIFDGWKNAGNLDYVCCWYKKCADFMQNTAIRTALVSTNSVSQGESVANLWKPLFESGAHIDFAHRTFRWDSEASMKAHVHCVIIGFSCNVRPKAAPLDKKRQCGETEKAPLDKGGKSALADRGDNPTTAKAVPLPFTRETEVKRLYDNDRMQIVENINGYLLNAPNVFVESRSTPICEVPEIRIGNMPLDGGNYLFTEEEMQEFIKKEPLSRKWFMTWYGSQEFINRKPRYCLWLENCPPNELRKMPECMKRVEAVRQFRYESSRASTKKMSEFPLQFGTSTIPNSDYVIIPKVSSERRRYVPMGFMSPDNLCSDLVFVIPNATLYHFGVLTSNVHMAWVRAVCGRLKSDYRYSKDIVYNNFPWLPEAPLDKGGDFRSKHNPALTDNARKLRKNMTKEEKHLWYDYLCSFPVRFLRQKVVGHYIVDFYCAKAKLVIELDGSQHYEASGIEYDKIRTEELQKYGLNVIRIPNNEVNENYSGVCQYIENIVYESLHRCAVPLPFSREADYGASSLPVLTGEAKAKIEQTAQAILDARALYPDCSLADLYDELTMPPELRKAHQANDRAVMQAYGFDIKTTTESSCVAELMKMYLKLTNE